MKKIFSITKIALICSVILLGVFLLTPITQQVESAKKDTGVNACVYKGEMKVTEGTNAGLIFNGIFSVVDNGANQIGGDFFVRDTSGDFEKDEKVALCSMPSGDPSKAKTIFVKGASVQKHLDKGDFLGACNDVSHHLEMAGIVEDDKVTMEFTLPNRTDKMVGTGDFPAEAQSCVAGTDVEGLLTGPAGDDEGDWIFSGTGRLIIKLAAPYACFAGCSYAGGSDSECDNLCGTQH